MLNPTYNAMTTISPKLANEQYHAIDILLTAFSDIADTDTSKEEQAILEGQRLISTHTSEADYAATEEAIECAVFELCRVAEKASAAITAVEDSLRKASTSFYPVAARERSRIKQN